MGDQLDTPPSIMVPKWKQRQLDQIEKVEKEIEKAKAVETNTNISLDEPPAPAMIPKWKQRQMQQLEKINAEIEAESNKNDISEPPSGMVTPQWKQRQQQQQQQVQEKIAVPQPQLSPQLSPRGGGGGGGGRVIRGAGLETPQTPVDENEFELCLDKLNVPEQKRGDLRKLEPNKKRIIIQQAELMNNQKPIIHNDEINNNNNNNNNSTSIDDIMNHIGGFWNKVTRASSNVTRASNLFPLKKEGSSTEVMIGKFDEKEILFSGWIISLSSSGLSIAASKERIFCILSYDRLSWYKTESQDHIVNSIELLGYEIFLEAENGFVLKSKQLKLKPYKFETQLGKKERDNWFDAISQQLIIIAQSSSRLTSSFIDGE